MYILTVRSEKPNKERMKKQNLNYSSEDPASFSMSLGDFSDLSNEFKRPGSEACEFFKFLIQTNCNYTLLEFGHQYLAGGFDLSLFDLLFQRKPKNPI